MIAEEESLVDEDDGEPFFDSMMDWVDGDDEERDKGTEDDYYEGLRSPYFPPDKKINILRNSG
jgi:General secretion pathway protein K.